MSSRSRFALRCVVPWLLICAAGTAWADEPAPQPQPHPDQAAQPTAAPVTPDATASATAPVSSAPPAVKRVLLLPIEYIAYQRSAGGVTEAVPEWTETCKANILATIRQLLGADSRFEVLPMPELTDDERVLLRDHVELFKVVSNDAYGVINYGGKVWQDKRANFDYTLGPGLKFLKERTGADAAFLFGGIQTTQSGGSVFLQLFMAGLTGAVIPGGGSFITFGSVNLEDGRIDWFNGLIGADVFGMGGVDMRKADSAAKTVGKLLAPYPASPLIGAKIH